MLIATADEATALDYATAASAFLGLLIAIVGIVIAVKAWKSAQQNLTVARDALKISQTEHEVFMESQNARAELVMSVQMVGAIANNRTIDAEAANLRWEVGIENLGNTTATNIRVNFLLPTMLTDPTWTNQSGTPVRHPTLDGGPNTTDEMLPSPNFGDAMPSHYLIKTIERLEPRRTHAVMFVSAEFVLGEPGVPIHIPVKAKAWCDELPDDVDSVDVEYDSTVTKADLKAPPV